MPGKAILRGTYALIIRLYSAAIELAGVLGHPKARLLSEGREATFPELTQALTLNSKPVIWMHAASLGEFEQGRTLFETLKEKHGDSHFFLLTFYSPSGYEVRKNYSYADVVAYLPADLPHRMNAIASKMNGGFALVIKYEYWYFMFDALRTHKVPVFIVSGIFHQKQPFFKWWGILQRDILSAVACFFLQDEHSIQLLSRLGNFTSLLCGDTRVDRVSHLAASGVRLPIFSAWAKDEKVLVAGSIYEHENQLIYAAKQAGHIKGKIAIVPHDVGKANIEAIAKVWGAEALLYSKAAHEANIADIEKDVLIVDTVGMLNVLYASAWVCILGGGFGKSIHNALEPAAFGVPILMGPKYHNFPEAAYFVGCKAALVFENEGELIRGLRYFSDSAPRQEAAEKLKAYIAANTGGSMKVYEYFLTAGYLR